MHRHSPGTPSRIVCDTAEATDTLRGWYDALEIVLVIRLVTGPVRQLFSRPAAEHSTPR